MEPDIRIFRKVLRMVSELHVRGYQRLRIVPGMAPSGMFWRCAVTPASNVLRSNGAELRNYDYYVRYTSGDERNYFGWTDARHATPSHFAELFLERFPDIAGAGYGPDWLYAGWYSHMLHLTHPDVLPVAYADMEDFDRCLGTWGPGPYREIPLPPPGEAYAQEEIVRDSGGYLVRVLGTLNAFRAKHGSWPTELCLTEEISGALRFHLTDQGMALLRGRLRLAVANGQHLMARDAEGRVLDYEQDEAWVRGQDQHADEWLGFGRLYS